MFERTRALIESLQKNYALGSMPNAQRLHKDLIQRALELFIESDMKFNNSSGLTDEWTEIGTEGASAILKSVELANRYDSNEQVTTKINRTYLLNLAAMEYYRCGRHGIAAAIISRPDAKLPNKVESSPTYTIVMLLQLFFTSKYQEASRLSKDYIDQVKRNILKNTQEKSHSGLSVIILLSLVFVYQTFISIEHQVINGEKSAEDPTSLMENSIQLSKDCGDLEYLMFLESLMRTVKSLQLLSIWNIGEILWKNNLPPLFKEWANHRILENKPFLFPSQYEAIITHNALNNTYELITMPTGGGKTLLAELFILKSLIDNPNGKVLLVVPTRSLAFEESSDLRRAYEWKGSPISVCQLTGDVAFDTKKALENNKVIVLTPEKFDILMRNSFFDYTVAGLVVDEFHAIRSSYRGIKIQLSIKRYYKRYGTRVLFMSAIVRNADFSWLSKWVLSPDPFSTQWKPTPARIGTVSIDERPIVTVSFNDGTYRDINMPKGLRRNASNQAGVQIVKTFLEEEKDQVLHYNMTWRTYKFGGNRLIDLAEEYMHALPNGQTFNKQALKELSIRFSRLAGKENKLAKAFEKGIAVHWGELPYVARKIVEKGIRQRAIGIILSTSTLAEGVNLPIKTVYIPKLATRTRNMEKSQFLNIIGRAGRPFFHAEGQVIIAINESGKEEDQTPKELVNDYALMKNEDIEPIITSAVEFSEILWKAISEWKIWEEGKPTPEESWEGTLSDDIKREFKKFLAYLEAISSALLACLEEGILSNIDSDLMDNLIFLGPETNEQKINVRRLLNIVEKRLIFFETVNRKEKILVLTDWGKIVYKTGFGPETCSNLRKRLKVIAEDYNSFKVKGQEIMKPDSRSYLFFNEMLHMLNLPLERYNFGDESFDDTDHWILRGWVSGVLTEDIAKRNKKLDGDFLRAYTKIDGFLSTYSAWVFTACYIAGDSLFGNSELIQSIHKLSRYILYGHYNEEILELLEKDVNRNLLRDDVIVLYKNLGNFKGLLEGKYSKNFLKEILDRSDQKTRMMEDEVVSAISSLASK
jgi:hypothetical protein